MAPWIWAGLDRASGVAGSGGASDGALSGIWRDAHAVWRAAARDGTTAAYTLLGLARCLMVMGRETRLAGLVALWCTARCR